VTNAASIDNTPRSVMTRCVEFVGQRDREILGTDPF